MTHLPVGVTRRRISTVHRMAVADARHDVARGLNALPDVARITQSADGDDSYAVYSRVLDAAYRDRPIVDPADAIAPFCGGDQAAVDWLEQNVYADVFMDESSLLVEVLCHGGIRPWGLS